MEIFIGIIIPFIGTMLGVSLVLFMKDKMNNKIQKALLGFASGVMIAASIWSLIIPAINIASNLGRFAFLPASIGFLLGIGFLLVLDIIIPHLHVNSAKPEGIRSNFKRQTMLVFSVTLHNIPEGLAVGVALAGAYYSSEILTMMGAIALSIGIGIQNFPEGAIISLPLRANGESKLKAFNVGFLSAIVEPVFALLAFVLTKYINPILPYVLSFAAGAMIYVVVEDLIPSTKEDEHSNFSTICLALGFVIMMVLDVALG